MPCLPVAMGQNDGPSDPWSGGAVVGEPDNSPSEPPPGWSNPSSRAWAAPEAPTADVLGPEPVPPTGSRRDEPAPVVVDPRHRRPQVPVRLQPLTVSDVLDGAWSIITCRPQPVYGVCAIVLVPTALVASLLARTFASSLDVWNQLRVFFPYIHPGGRASPGWLGAACATALVSLATFVIGVALARMVMGWYDGRESTAVRAVGEALRRAPAILGAFLVLLIPKVAGIAAFLVPAWILFPFLLLVAPVIAFEDAGPFRAIKRSFALVGKRYFRVLAIWSIWLIAERVISFALVLLVEFVSSFTPDDVDAILMPAGWAFAAFITAPAVAGMSVIIYLDMRVRSEAMDLEREVTEAFARA
jgi:hypothetical protein